MPEEFLFGLIWGVLGTLLLQVASMAIYRMGSRHSRRAVEPAIPVAARAVPPREVEGELQVAQIERMQQRLAVLEQITTDSGYRTARAIDDLR